MAADPTRKLTSFLATWAGDPRRRMVVRDNNLTALQEALARGDVHVVTTRARGYATWLCGSGQARVLAGDAHGWQDVRLGAALLRTAMVLAHRHFARVPRGTARRPQPIDCANSTAMALALGDPDADELYRWHRHGWPADTQMPDYAVYVQALLDLRANGHTDAIGHCGAHDGVLRAWATDGLGDALDAALQWHTGPGVRDDDEAVGEFVDITVSAFPVEVLAVLAVCRVRGLPLPRLRHALGTTPLCSPPLDGAWPDDPILDRVHALLQTVPGR